MKTRASEPLSQRDVNRITAKIAAGEGFKEQSSCEHTKWTVCYKGRIYHVMFDDVHGCIASIMAVDKIDFSKYDDNPFGDLVDIRDALPTHKPARNRP